MILFHHWYSSLNILSIELTCAEENQAQVFFDRGDGIRELDSIRLDYRGLNDSNTFQIKRKILLPDEVIGIRIDPGRTDKTVFVKEFTWEPAGSIRQYELFRLIDSEGSERNGVSKLIEESERTSVIEVEQGSNDPWILFDLKDLYENPKVRRSFSLHDLFWILRSTFVLSLILLVGLICLQQLLRWFGKSENHLKMHLHQSWVQKGATNVKRYWARSLLLAIITTVAVQTVREINNCHRFEIRFHLKAEGVKELWVYFDKGWGWNDQDSVVRFVDLKGKRRQIYFRHNSIRPVTGVRIDPRNSSGMIELSDVEIRTGHQPWRRVNFDDWRIRDTIDILERSENHLLLFARDDDPFLGTNELFPDPSPERHWVVLKLINWATYLAVCFALILTFVWFGVGSRIPRYKGTSTQDQHNSWIRWQSYLLFMAYVVSALVLFAGFFPGNISGDAQADILNALNGKLESNEPPLLQNSIGFIQQFTVRQWPLLFMQLTLHFTGFGGLSLFFQKRNQWVFAWLAFVISLFPHLIYIHSLIVKDVLIAGLWLNAIIINLWLIEGVKSRVIKRVLLLVALGLILLSVLCRDNTFVAAPILLMMTFSNAFPRFSLYRIRKLRVLNITAQYFVLLAASFSFMQIMNSAMLQNQPNRNYSESFFVSQICSNDLIGLSTMNPDRGITQTLDYFDKNRLEMLLCNKPVYWLESELWEQIFPKGFDVLKEWNTYLLNHPRDYFAYRIYLFCSFFFDKPATQMSLIGQATQIDYIEDNILSHEVGVSTDIFRVSEDWENNWIYNSFERIIRLYFERISDWVFGGLLLFHIWHFLTFRSLNDSAEKRKIISFIAAIVSTACCYVFPFLFAAQHAETRYVYPAVLLCFVSGLLIASLYVPHALKKE